MRRSWLRLSQKSRDKKSVIREYEGLQEVSNEQRIYTPIRSRPRGIPMNEELMVTQMRTVPEADVTIVNETTTPLQSETPISDLTTTAPLEAELVQPEQQQLQQQFNSIQHYQDPEDGLLYCDSAFPPLPDCSARSKYAILTLRNSWFLRKDLPVDQQAVGYPFALEELLVRSSLGLELNDEKLSELLLDAFTVSDEEDLLEEKNIIMWRPNKREFLESASCSCYVYSFHKLARTQDEGIENSRRPKIFMNGVVIRIVKLLNLATEEAGLHWSKMQRSSHLLIRFLARHHVMSPYSKRLELNKKLTGKQSRHCYLRVLYDEYILTNSAMTDNIMVRFYAKQRIDYVHGFLYSQISKNDNPTYGDTLEQLIWYNTSKERYVQSGRDALRTCSGLNGSVYLTISTWCSIIYAWQHFATLEEAMQLADAVLERFYEEFGNYRAIPLDDTRHVLFKRGRLKGAILPKTLGMRFMITLFNMMAPDHNRQAKRLQKIREIIDDLVVDSPYSRSIKCLEILRKQGTAAALNFVRHEMMNSSTVRLVPAAVLNVVLEEATKDVQALRRKREPFQELARDYAADAMHILAANKQHYFKTDYTGLPAPRVISILEEKIFKLLIRSEDAPSAAAWVFEVMRSQRENLPSYVSIILKLCARVGKWQTAESTMFAYIGSRPAQMTDITSDKNGYILASHLFNPPLFTERRCNRIFEVCLQVLLKGEPISVDSVEKILRLCSEIAFVGGDVLIPVQNKQISLSAYKNVPLPVGISPQILCRRMPGRRQCTVCWTSSGEDGVQKIPTMKEEVEHVLPLTSVVPELIRNGLRNVSMLTDIVVMEIIYFWITIGQPEQIPDLLMTFRKNITKRQAVFIDTALLAVEVSDIEDIKKSLKKPTEIDINEYTSLLKKLVGVHPQLSSA